MTQQNFSNHAPLNDLTQPIRCPRCGREGKELNLNTKEIRRWKQFGIHGARAIRYITFLRIHRERYVMLLNRAYSKVAQLNRRVQEQEDELERLRQNISISKQGENDEHQQPTIPNLRTTTN